MASQAEAENLRQLERLREFEKEVRIRRVRAESRDGMVAATALLTGQVVEIEIDPRVYRNPDSKGLAASILEAIGAASAAAGKEHLEGLSAVTGMRSDSFTGILESAAEYTDSLFDEVTDIRRSR